MKNTILLTLSLLVFTGWLAIPKATTSNPNTYVAADIEGSWQGEGHTINSRGKNLTKKKLLIEVDEQGLITGESGWELVDGAGGFNENKPVTGDSEKLIGVFMPESGEIHLVEMAEHGVLHGKLISKDQLRMVLTQAGEKPAASTYVLTRVKK